MDAYTLDKAGLDEIASLGMLATILALEADGVISAEYADDFRSNHVCQLVTSTGIWKAIWNKLGLGSETKMRAAIFRIKA